MDHCEALRAAYSPDPLCHQRHAAHVHLSHLQRSDGSGGAEHLRFYEALVKAGVPSEAHVFANGPHGSGLGKGDPALDQWPGLLETWLRAQGLLTADKPATSAR